MRRGDNPFNNLGAKLAYFRRQRHKTADEVAAAVEIDKERLLAFERGEARPAEDILGLLISHFDLDEEEAAALWQMADYGGDDLVTENQMIPQAAIMLLPIDARVVYSDAFQVTINKQGVIFNFLQSNGTKQQLPIAKIGMSLDHANEVLSVLQQTMQQANAIKQPKQLPQAKPKSDPNNKHK